MAADRNIQLLAEFGDDVRGMLFGHYVCVTVLIEALRDIESGTTHPHAYWMQMRTCHCSFLLSFDQIFKALSLCLLSNTVGVLRWGAGRPYQQSMDEAAELALEWKLSKLCKMEHGDAF